VNEIARAMKSLAAEMPSIWTSGMLAAVSRAGSSATNASHTRRRPVLLGLDAGTSSLKALVLDGAGQVLGEAAAAYPTLTPAPGWAEQDPEAWWAAAVTAVRTAMAEVGADAEVAGIGLSGQMHTFVLVDAHGVPVRPAVTWLDTRARDALAEVRATVESRGLARTLGNPVVLGLSLPPLVWLREHEPDVWARTATFLSAKDYLRLRLTDEIGAEATDASATLAFDVTGRRWSQAVQDAFGLPRSWWPTLGGSGDVAGHLTPTAGAALGLPAGIPVAYGAGDQQASALGAGTVRPGQRQLTVGTGAQAIVVRAESVVDPLGRLHTFAHVHGWLSQASVNNAGVALGWVRARLGLDWAEMYATLDDPELDDAPTFLPYLTGERTPLMKGEARGAWLGLAPEHGTTHLARAAVEGVVSGIADAVATLAEIPATDAAEAAGVWRVVGGGVREPAFAQALADATGARFDVLASSSASALGAALLGGVAAGTFADVVAAADVAPVEVLATFVPRPERRAAWSSRSALARELDASGFHEIVARHRSEPS
jgi:xylulokinase